MGSMDQNPIRLPIDPVIEPPMFTPLDTLAPDEAALAGIGEEGTATCCWPIWPTSGLVQPLPVLMYPAGQLNVSGDFAVVLRSGILVAVMVGSFAALRSGIVGRMVCTALEEAVMPGVCGTEGALPYHGSVVRTGAVMLMADLPAVTGALVVAAMSEPILAREEGS